MIGTGSIESRRRSRLLCSPYLPPTPSPPLSGARTYLITRSAFGAGHHELSLRHSTRVERTKGPGLLDLLHRLEQLAYAHLPAGPTSVHRPSTSASPQTCVHFRPRPLPVHRQLTPSRPHTQHVPLGRVVPSRSHRTYQPLAPSPIPYSAAYDIAVLSITVPVPPILAVNLAAEQ